MAESEQRATVGCSAWERLSDSVRTVQRFRGWAVHVLLSAAMMCATLDAFPVKNMELREIISFGLCAASILVAFFISSLHYVRPLRKVGESMIEFVVSIFLYACWIGMSVFILNPKWDIATTIEEETGVERIQYANIYILTWMVMLSNFYLVTSYFYDFSALNFKVICWIFLVMTSLTMALVSFQLRDGICDEDNVTRCSRTRYLSTIGAIIGLISLVALILYVRDEISLRNSLILESITAVLNVHSLIISTSVNGPARNFSSIFFSTWIGSTLSCLLLINSGHQTIVVDSGLDKEEASIGGRTQVPESA